MRIVKILILLLGLLIVSACIKNNELYKQNKIHLVFDNNSDTYYPENFRVIKNIKTKNISSAGLNKIRILGSGADLIYGRAGNDAIYGDEQNDLVFGDNGNDFISLGIGDDSASGGLGDDTINGDDGNDTIYGDDGNDIISGGLGDDTINGGTGDDTINGNENNDIIHGNDGIDNISGGVGNDTLYGDAGNDTLNGDDGNDIIYGNAGSDIINGGNGTDTVSYLDAVLSALTINLTEGKARGFNNGNEEIDTLQSIENVIGSNSTDYITGDNLTNYLQGMGGNDFFYWTLGNDYYDGGDGADVVTVTAGSTTPMTISYGNTFSIERFIGGSNNDVITGINSPSNAPVTLTGGGGKDKFSFDLNAFSGDNIGRVAPVKALVTDFTTAVTPNSANSKDFLEFDLASGIAATVNTSFVTVNNQMSTLVKVCVGASSIAEITLQGTVLGFGSADYGFI